MVICIDNKGEVTKLYDSTKNVLGESCKSPTNDALPHDPKRTSKLKTDALFKTKIQKLANGEAVKSAVLREKVGYEFSGNLATVVHQRDVEVDFGERSQTAVQNQSAVSK